MTYLSIIIMPINVNIETVYKSARLHIATMSLMPAYTCIKMSGY